MSQNSEPNAILETIVSLLEKTEFWSAVAGAVVGGLIAFGVQTIALREARKQRKEEQFRQKQTLGHGILFKMLRIHSNFSWVHRHIENCISEAAEMGKAHIDPWKVVTPIANPTNPVRFTTDEMSMLLSLNSEKVFNEVLQVDEIHNTFMDAIRVYRVERQSLTSKIPVTDVEGRELSSLMTDEEYRMVGEQVIVVNHLIKQIRSDAEENYKTSRKTLKGLSELLTKELAFSKKLVLVQHEEDP